MTASCPSRFSRGGVFSLARFRLSLTRNMLARETILKNL